MQHNVPHYRVLGGYRLLHGAEITKQRQLLTETKLKQNVFCVTLYFAYDHHQRVIIMNMNCRDARLSIYLLKI